MAAIITPTATNTQVAAAAAAVPNGTLVRYTYTYNGRAYAATGTVKGVDGTMLFVTVVSHEEFPDNAGFTMGWSACWCELA